MPSRRRSRRRRTSVRKSNKLRIKKSRKQKSVRKRRSMKHSRKRRSRRKSRSRKRQYMTVSRCKELLKNKIRVNMIEYNNGKYANRKQAIAVAYSQVTRNYPQCKGKI